MNKKFSSIIFLITISFLVLNCSPKKTSPIKQPDPIPEWYLQAYEPQDGYIYGIGSSTNLSRAKERALRDLAAKIEVSIKSNTEATSRKNNAGNSQRFEERINTTVKEFTFLNPKTNKQEIVNGEYYLRMRVSLDSIIQNTTSQIEDLKSKLDQIYSDAEKKNKLEQLFLLKSNEANLNEAIFLINRLDSLYQITPFKPVNSLDIQANRNLFNHYASTLQNLTFSISVNLKIKQKYNKFGFIISNLLAEAGIKNETNASGNSDAVLDIDVVIEKSKLLNDFLVKAKIVFLLKDNNGRALQNNVISVKAFSPLSHENALVGLESKFKSMLEKEGILKVLGI